MVEIHWLWLPIMLWAVLTVIGWAFETDEKPILVGIWGFVTLACVIIYGFEFLKFLFTHVKIIA